MVPIRFDEIRPLYGHELASSAVDDFLRRFTDHRVRRPGAGVQHVLFRSLGFDLAFRRPAGVQVGQSKHPRVLTTAFLYRQGHDRHDEFPDRPFGVSFEDARDDLLRKLGEPARTSMPGGVRISPLGVMYWDLWHVDGLAVHATYGSAAGPLDVLAISAL